jgi:diguanylate cyclase
MLLVTFVITFHTGVFFREWFSFNFQKTYLFYALTLTPILIYTYIDRKLIGVALFFLIALPLQKVSHLHLKLKTQEEELLRDHLTKAYNYRFFQNVIDNRLGKGQSFSLIMMDIDKFKQINDTYGHVAGNIVLEEAARVIMSVLPSTSLLFRYGGDEFCILARSQDEATEIINDLLNRFKDFHVNYNYQKITIGLSMGVCHQDEEKTVEEIIEKADQAMYLTKLKGGNNASKFSKLEKAL